LVDTGIPLTCFGWASRKKLRESESRYKSLIEVSRDAIFINQDDRIVYLNPAAIKLFKASSAKERYLGKRCPGNVP
jgi:PAS domain-containing protein